MQLLFFEHFENIEGDIVESEINLCAQDVLNFMPAGGMKINTLALYIYCCYSMIQLYT